MPLAAAAALLTSDTDASGATPGGVVVTLKDIDFHRAKVTIRRGQTVTWRWQDGYTPHNVYSTGHPRFKGADAREAGTHVVRFTKAGIYRYVCTIHLNMKGAVVVK